MYNSLKLEYTKVHFFKKNKLKKYEQAIEKDLTEQAVTKHDKTCSPPGGHSTNWGTVGINCAQKSPSKNNNILMSMFFEGLFILFIFLEKQQ